MASADEVPLFATRRRRLKRGRVLLVLLAAVIQCAIILAVPLATALLFLGAWYVMPHQIQSYALALKEAVRTLPWAFPAAEADTQQSEPTASEMGMGLAPADLQQRTHNLFVHAEDLRMPVGVSSHYACVGPWKLPERAGLLFRFQPEADLGIVHHMILYGRAGGPSSCRFSDILYSWARTGQTTRPTGLDLALESPGTRLGFEVGAQAAGYTHVSLQIHYQRDARAPPMQRGDRSGIHLTIELAPPSSPPPRTVPLRVHLLELVPWIPARSFVDRCVRCTVRRGGVVYAHRNHGHRLARDVWSDHLKVSDGAPAPRALPPLGFADAQGPQVVRVLAEPRLLEVGDILQLHCLYNATQRDTPTGYSIDEALGEMCNQYLFASRSLSVTCGLSGACRSTQVTS